MDALGIELVTTFEGWYPNAYNDPVGVCTKWYGEVIRHARCTAADYANTPRISEAEGRKRLAADIDRRYVQPLLALVNSNVNLTQGMVNALGSLVYNIGLGAWASSTLRRLLNARDYAGARAQFDRWVYAGGRVFLGLQRRRDAEQEMWDTGDSLIAKTMPKLTGYQARLIGFAEKATTASALTKAADKLKAQIERTKNAKMEYRDRPDFRTQRPVFNTRLDIFRREREQALRKLERLGA